MDQSTDYATAMAYLEAGCEQHGIASIKFKDGEMVMVSLEMLKQLAETATQKGQTRVLIFIATGPILKGGVQA